MIRMYNVIRLNVKGGEFMIDNTDILSLFSKMDLEMQEIKFDFKNRFDYLETQI